MSRDLASLVGQSLMFRYRSGSPADRETFNRIEMWGAFFGDNLTSRNHSGAHPTAQKRRAGRTSSFIAAGREGGIVTRLPADMVTVPSAMGLGALSEDVIRESAASMPANFDRLVSTQTTHRLRISTTIRRIIDSNEIVWRNTRCCEQSRCRHDQGHLEERVIPTVKHWAREYAYR